MAKEKLPPAFPDFLIIGAPQAGGDIIKKLLLQNPKIWFPPLDNILAFHPGFQIERFQIARDFIKAKVPLKQLKNISWLLRYFLQPVPTKKWYSKLFRTKQQDLIKGEFSDEYITLPFDEVEKLHRLMPNCKIILMIRHPVDRSFAALREKFKDNKKTPFNKLSKRQMIALMNSDWARSHSSYQSALDCWPVFFPMKNVYIGFYEDLIANPATFMTGLHKFLGTEQLATAQDLPTLMPSAQKAFPISLLAHLHPFYRHELEGLANRLNGHAGTWFDEFNASISKKQAEPATNAESPLVSDLSGE